MKKALIAIYCLFITFLVVSAVYATRTFDGAYADPYETGMRYTADRKQIEELGWNFSTVDHPLSLNKASLIELLVFDNNGEPVQGAEVVMEISRVAQAEKLQVDQVVEREAGHYDAVVSLPFYGHCRVDAVINFQGKSVPCGFRIYVEENK